MTLTKEFSETENIIIIGGGPAGLSAALYNARANLRPLVFAGSPPGGQLTLTSEVENYPGFESILGQELIDKIRVQATKFKARIVDENIMTVDFSRQPFIVNTLSKTYQSRAILIATGAKALWLGLPSEQKLRGRGVSACATCDGFFFRNKTVAVIGGGDTAMEEAHTLTRFADKVYIIHRRDSFRASKIMVDRVINNPKIQIIWNSVIEEMLGEQRVEGLKAKSVTDGKIREIKLDGVFIAIGHKPDTDLFQGQIELDKKGYILTFNRLAEEYLRGKIDISAEKMAKIKNAEGLYSSHTSVRGVFAAGDCVDHIYRQAATAAGMGVAAGLDVEKFIETEY
ncbi:MAG: Thioredoxin reductase [Candidatus Roizmanbacteria bacterium GW2011_GWA2_36_23]|uniref:Thioredoxin reductase n=1 Tax=Candidatus Roizmanbacteria bacterium GW2011_GWA2_36_23 TaxID=1618480 RepID=A0A0G0EKR3_9BACT|nr:MAG: Thioredoxin reductase [Candidatus Roizmanbacteria bacterium GW2011_GWA2_36_23]